jgi:hypothetical protein
VWDASLLKTSKGLADRSESFRSCRQGLGRIQVKLLAWISALFAWKVVRQYDGYTYFQNAITGQHSCRWDRSTWGRIDYNFMRRGDVSYGPFGRRVFD